MKIKIDKINIDKIKKELQKVEGKAKERLIDLGNLMGVAPRIYDHLKNHGISKKNAQGIVIVMPSFEGKMPGAYKYQFGVTLIRLEICSSGVFVINVERKVCYPSESIKMKFSFNRAHKELICKNAIKKAETI